MKSLFRLVKRYLLLTSKKQMSYPGNVIGGLVSTPIMLVMEFFALYFTFYITSGTIQGWTAYEMGFVLFHVHLLTYLTSFFGLYHPSVSAAIYMGQLDFYLIKPQSFFLLFFGERLVFLNVLRIILLSAGSIVAYPVLATLLSHAGSLWTYIFIVISSTCLLVSIYLFLLAFQFYGNITTKALNNMSTFTNLLKNPKNFYPSSMQWIFTFIFPFFLILSPLYDWLHNTYTFEHMMLTSTICLVCIGLCIVLWNKGMQAYDSAN